MKAIIIDKKSGARRQIDDGQLISTDRPAVVLLKLAPENVARYERRGDDLVLVLKDGQEIAIRGFFIKYSEANDTGEAASQTADGSDEHAGRNELMLEDDYGVAWWGQYPEEWSEFHFTEIELDDVAGFAWWPILLGVLGGGGALAAFGGGGGGSDKGSPPVAIDDSARGSEDGAPITGNVLNNDTDADADALNVTGFTINGSAYNVGAEVRIAGVGSFTLGANGAYTFTPDANWNGTVPTVTYTVSDGEGGSDTANLVITVDPANDAPTGVSTVADQVDTDAETMAALDVTTFFTDIDGGALTYNANGLPQGLSIDPVTGVISGTIDPSASQGGVGGVHTVTVTATDGDGASVDQTFNWTITNPEPVANNDAAATDEDVTVSGNVLTGAGAGDVADSDPDGDSLSITGFTVAGDPALYGAGDIVAIVGIGSFTLGSDGAYTFTPDANWNGIVPTVTYTVSDGEGGSDNANLVITVDPALDLIAADDSATTNEDTPVTGSVASNDSTASGGALTFAKASDPSNGTVIVNSDGTYTYTPNSNYNGPDSFTYTVTDPTSGESRIQTVSVTVGPIADLSAADDSTTTNEDTPVTGSVAGNDSTTSGGGLNFTKTSDPANGTVVVNPDGSYIYTPNLNYNGPDSFTYTVMDPASGESRIQTVTITVSPVNDAPTPVGAIPDQADADAETVAALDVTTFFTDIDSSTLTYSVSGLPQGLSIDPVTGIISGTIDPSASQDGLGGMHSVTVTATDGDGASVDQVFNWSVTNPAPVANNDAAATDEDVAVSGNVLTGVGVGDVADSDPDGDSLSVTGFAIAGDPALYSAGDVVAIAGIGSYTLGSDGAYTFTPDANWNGTVPTVTYTVSDGEGGSDTANLVITVDPVNDAPTIAGGGQSGTIVEAGNLDDGTATAGTPNAAGSFSAVDADADALTWSILGTPDATYGAFSIDPATGAWAYALNNALPATQALNEGDVVPLTYTVQVSDGNGGTATRNITITVTGTNDAPVAASDSGAVTEAGVLGGGNTATPGVASANGNVLTNDADIDAGEKATLEVSGVSFAGASGTVGSGLTGTYGTLLLSASGAYVYTLNNADPDTQALGQGDTATDTFTYSTVDVNGASSTSTLTITLTGTNDRPVITSDAAAATGSVVETGTGEPGTDTTTGVLTASDVDDGATRTWNIATTNGTYGTIAIDPATGLWTYTIDNMRAATQGLNSGDTGQETFTARVTDEFGAFSEQIITINVVGSNDDLVGTLTNAIVPLVEDGSASGTLQDYVSDVDDVLQVTGFQVDADGDGSPENFAPGSVVILTDSDGNARGTLTIAADGAYSFTPAANYSGAVPTITYAMAETSGGTGTVSQTISFDITPVADAPDLEVNKTVNTTEDTPGALGLIVPVITDDGTGTGGLNDDYPERLGEITLTITGAGASGVTLSSGATVLTPVGGKITIVLTDVDHVTSVPVENNATGVYYLTSAQYAALAANPPAESGRDFTVTVSSTSYEVDGSGGILPGVAGATSTQIIDVDVLAVTDGATLTINGTSSATITGGEDSVIDLAGLLAVTRNDTDATTGADTDGSETYWYAVSGLPIGTVVTINGVATTISAIVPTATSPATTSAAAPTITIAPPANYSGDIEDVTITLNSRDTDTDSTGVIGIVSSSVELDLYITPVAGDVAAGDVTTLEDTATAFLAAVRVTDTGSATGSEVIDSVAFTVPTGWTVTPPPMSAGWTYNLAGDAATITFDSSLTEAQREAILDAFTIQPPAHSSTDTTITLSITTTDTNVVNGTPVSDTKTVDREVDITVTPVAERTDTDSDSVGGNDVTLLADHAYSASGQEDAWFALGTNYTGAANAGGGHDLLTGWSNADADEFTYAVLTPTLAPDSPGDDVNGTQFRYSTDGGATWITQTYVGEAIWVPQQYLDTLQVQLPTNVSGTMTIGVQAGTVDYDDDTDVATLPLDPPKVSGAGVNVSMTGLATLSIIKIDPVADAVTMALNGRATGVEDSPVPLAIRTTSSDPSEIFDVTISGIPIGATVTYGTGPGAISFTATPSATSFDIPNFSNSAPVAITPPLHSNNDFSLTVSAVSVDGASTSPPVSRTIDVSITGVADIAAVTLPPIAYATTEAVLDAGNHQIALADLITEVASADADGSEVTTLRITGLSADFSVAGATMITSGAGGARVWIVSADNLANVSIVTPPNYSGTVSFKVGGVTTENDGDSLTGALTDVNFTVAPSPEATITTSATLVEDAVTPLNLEILLQNGDGDEALGQIYIAQNYAAGADYVVYLGALSLDAAGLGTTVINGVTYFVIEADQVSDLGAVGASNLDADLGTLDFLYNIIDPSSDGTLTAVTQNKPGTLTLSATPVTDAVDASITAIVLTTATGTTTDTAAGDDASPDTATVTASGALTVQMHIDSVDSDGSEHLVRILITGVPDGVTVTGASQIGAGSWLLVYDAVDAKSIGAGGIDVPVEFIVGIGAGDGLSTITMTALSRDQGQSASTPASVETDAVSWSLALDLADGGTYLPPVIDEWNYNGALGTEDTSFDLGDVMDAAVSVSDGSLAYSYTVTITDLPPGTTVAGMTLTTIGGVPTWTATVTAPAGADSQAALDALLAGISITPPANSNDNNGSFGFDARLVASVVGGPSVQADDRADIPVTPVTDGALITVNADDVAEGVDSVSAVIDVQLPSDAPFGQVVNGRLYVQVSTTNNDGGTVTDGSGAVVPPSAVSGVPGITDGTYYVIDVGAAGGSVELTYAAATGVTLKPGDVTFTAYAQTQETGAGNIASASASDTAAVEIANNGVTGTNQAVAGFEPAAADKNNAIELSGLAVALNDTDGSESIRSILLSGVPVGFLLYVGNTAGDATLAAQASNAGGDGITNTWVLSSVGTLPAYVAILPAPHWSGTLPDLALVVESGEASLPTTQVDTVPLETVTVEAVANGLVIDPTVSFGQEGRLIDLNLNAAMADAAAASAAVADGSTETTSLRVTGLGEHAAFYVGDGLVSSVSYDLATDTYTITGLSQDDLDDLGFVQASAALADQDGATGGTQVTVTAWTVESANGAQSVPVTDTLTLSVAPTLASTGNDNLIWDGDAVNGRAGIDTVALRHGEDLDHSELAGLLRNIEVIDLSVVGSNSITGGLSISDVLTITGSINGLLTINGSSDDAVELSSANEWTTDGIANGGHLIYTSVTSSVTLSIDEDIQVSYAA